MCNLIALKLRNQLMALREKEVDSSRCQRKKFKKIQLARVEIAKKEIFPFVSLFADN